MSDQPISDLRHRMLQDMTVRQFSEKTQHDYIRHIEVFSKFLGRSPATATGDDLRRFQFQQTQDGAQPPKLNTQASALRFLFTITLGRPDLAHQLARTYYPKKLPRVLSPDDVGPCCSKRRRAPASSTKPRSAWLTARVCAAARL